MTVREAFRTVVENARANPKLALVAATLDVTIGTAVAVGILYFTGVL